MPAEPRNAGTAASGSGSGSTSATAAGTASTTAATGSKKRSIAPKRGAIACVRCKERKAKCVPAPPGTSPVPTCTNCLSARKECVYLERTPNEIFLLEYVSQLEARCAALEVELRKVNPASNYASDHIHMPAEARSAAVNKLNQVYPPTAFPAPDQTTTANANSNPSAPSVPTGEHLVKIEEGISNPPTGSSGNSFEVNLEGEEGDEEDLALGIGMLSLGGGEEPVYVGPSSGINWARVCATALRRPRDRSQPSNLSRFSYLAPPELASVQSALEYTLHHPTPPLPPPALASHYLDLVYDHIQARYGCFDWRVVRNWHENREAICQGRPLWGVGWGADERRNLASFFLWLCYGYGAKLSEDQKLEGAVNHEVYYNAAVSCLSTLTSHHSLATVQALILLIIYGLRHPTAEVSVWQVGGLAMRTAVELGLHRRMRSKVQREKDPLRYEMKKRVFWAVYTLDRMMSAQLGRPSGIQDRDIDVELPLNVDYDFSDAQALAAMQNRQIEMMAERRPGEEYAGGYGPTTSMTSAIHNIRGSQLKQMITNAIYRLDKPLRPPRRDGTADEPESNPEVDQLLQRLNLWRALDPTAQRGVPMLSREYWELEYHDCIQLLLRPIIANRKAGSRYISLCLESASIICETQSLVLRAPVPKSKLSTWRFYRLFLAGLTVLHIITTFNGVLSDHERARAERAIHKCQTALGAFGSTLKRASRHEYLFSELVAAWEHNHGITSSSGENGSGGEQIKQEHATPRASISGVAGGTGTTEEMIARLFDMSSGAGTTGTIGTPSTSSLPLGQNSMFNQHSHGGQHNHGFMQVNSYGQGHQSALLGGQADGATGALGVGLAGNLTSNDDWSTMLGEMGSGMKDDFFSLMSSFGIDTDNQTPFLNHETSDPIFDFSFNPTLSADPTLLSQSASSNGSTGHLGGSSQSALNGGSSDLDAHSHANSHPSAGLWSMGGATPSLGMGLGLPDAGGGMSDWTGLFAGFGPGGGDDEHGHGLGHGHGHAGGHGQDHAQPHEQGQAQGQGQGQGQGGGNDAWRYGPPS
ncbi:hypothetical protein IAU60_006588 [Kwoniella sp. DSM 27419]